MRGLSVLILLSLVGSTAGSWAAGAPKVAKAPAAPALQCGGKKYVGVIQIRGQKEDGRSESYIMYDIKGVSGDKFKGDIQFSKDEDLSGFKDGQVACFNLEWKYGNPTPTDIEVVAEAEGEINRVAAEGDVIRTSLLLPEATSEQKVKAVEDVAKHFKLNNRLKRGDYQANLEKYGPVLDMLVPRKCKHLAVFIEKKWNHTYKNFGRALILKDPHVKTALADQKHGKLSLNRFAGQQIDVFARDASTLKKGQLFCFDQTKKVKRYKRHHGKKDRIFAKGIKPFSSKLGQRYAGK